MFQNGTPEAYYLYNQHGYLPTTVYNLVIIRYNSLVDMFKNGHYFIEGVVATGSTSIDYFTTPIEINDPISIFSKQAGANILGRMAHLLADMNVPAHTRMRSHPCDLHHGEFYEQWMGGKDPSSALPECSDMPPAFAAQYWDYLDASNQGSFLKPNEKNNPLKYLFYTTAQITDVYNCYRYQTDGPDDLFPGNRNFQMVDAETGDDYSEMAAIISNIPSSFNSWEEEVDNQGENSFTYLIRATAGLFYMFAKETDLVVDINIKNNFSGGEIKIDDEIHDSLPHNFESGVGTSHTFKAIEPQFANNSHQIWNDTESPSADKSEWEKYDVFFNQQTIANNQNQTYYLNVQSDDADATYVADMKEAHKVDKNYNTEFQGVISNDPKYMVKYSSGNIIADQWIYPNGYPLVFGGWGDQIVPNNSWTRAINNINQDLEINANYKYLQHASSSAFISPGQRRFAKTSTPNGELIDMVYESGGNVWYEFSVDGGLHWNVYQVGIDGAKNPAMARTEYYAFIVYQQDNKLHLSTFDDYGLVEDIEMDDLGTISSRYASIAVRDDEIMIIYKRSDGLYYVFGHELIGYFSEYNRGKVNGTDANCRRPSVAVDNDPTKKFTLHLVYEKALSVNYTDVLWKVLENTWSHSITQSSSEIVSTGSGYSWNEKPVVAVMDNGTPRVVWQGGIEALQKVSIGLQQQSRTYRTCLRARDGNGNNWYPTIWKFGSNTEYGSIQRSADNNYIIGWLEGTNVKYARNNDYFVRDSGLDGYGLQLASGASTRNDITFSSVSNGNEPRWFVYTDGLGKENSITPFYGREGAVSINSIDYYFVLADIFHNNAAVDFVELEEDDFISNFTELNSKLESEPFEISSGDELYFSILYGLTAFEEDDVILSETDFVDFKVELIDVTNNSILGTFDHISYTSDNYALFKDIAYSVNTDGIGDKTVKLRLVVNSSETGKFALSSINSDSQILYKPSSPQEIYFSGDSNIVEEYTLLNCYPNPFNPTTNIEFHVKEAGFVDLRIYNILGEEITKLVNKKMAPGKHTVEFDAKYLPSGVYIYKLSINDFVESKKMILTK